MPTDCWLLRDARPQRMEPRQLMPSAEMIGSACARKNRAGLSSLYTILASLSRVVNFRSLCKLFWHGGRRTTDCGYISLGSGENEALHRSTRLNKWDKYRAHLGLLDGSRPTRLCSQTDAADQAYQAIHICYATRGPGSCSQKSRRQADHRLDVVRARQ